MTELAISNAGLIAFFLAVGAIVSTCGGRLSKTAEEWARRSWMDKYGHLALGLPSSAIAASAPVFITAFEQQLPALADLLSFIILALWLIGLVTLFAGGVLCIGGPRDLRAQGKTWK